MVGQPYGQKLSASSPEASNFREGDRNSLFWDALWLVQPLSHDHLWANHNRQIVDTLRPQLVECLRVELASFPWTIICWKKLTVYEVSTWVLAEIFSKMNEMNLLVQGKQLTVFVASGKIWASRENFNFGRHVFVTMFDNVPTLKDFSEIGGDINKRSF